MQVVNIEFDMLMDTQRMIKASLAREKESNKTINKLKQIEHNFMLFEAIVLILEKNLIQFDTFNNKIFFRYFLFLLLKFPNLKEAYEAAKDNYHNAIKEYNERAHEFGLRPFYRANVKCRIHKKDVLATSDFRIEFNEKFEKVKNYVSQKILALEVAVKEERELRKNLKSRLGAMKTRVLKEHLLGLPEEMAALAKQMACDPVFSMNQLMEKYNCKFTSLGDLIALYKSIVSELSKAKDEEKKLNSDLLKFKEIQTSISKYNKYKYEYEYKELNTRKNVEFLRVKRTIKEFLDSFSLKKLGDISSEEIKIKKQLDEIIIPKIVELEVDSSSLLKVRNELERITNISKGMRIITSDAL